jgi:hypothetical protein
LDVAAGEEAQPNAAARHIAEIRFRTRFMVLILPFDAARVQSSGVNLEEPGTYQPPFSSVKPLRPGKASEKGQS